jgi:hypothetical protein
VKNGLNNFTPYELWTGKKPNLAHIRVFGSTVMKHIPKEKRCKWDKKAEKCILIGFPENIKGYRLYNPATKSISTSRDVIIMEQKNAHQEHLVEVEELLHEPEPSPIPKCTDPVEDTPENTSELEESFVSTSSTDINDVTYVPSDAEDPVTPVIKDRPVRLRRKPDMYGYMCVDQDSSGNELTLEQALQGPEKEFWEQAVKDELQSFDDNRAWEIVDTPKGGTVVKCKWVLKKKCDSDNNVRYRARLVAKGCTQKYGVDYEETFSPVVRHTTLRLLFALSVQLDLDVIHLDVKTAFLNGDLDETIYMQKPAGFVCSDPNKVLKLNKAIYGLKQASRAWHKKVDSCMLTDGYKRSDIEPCLYTKIVGNNKTMVTLYVDDFLIFSNDQEELKHLKAMLCNNFKIKDLGQVKECLGMSVRFDKKKGIVTLSQKKYVDELLRKFNMFECKTVNTPMEANLKSKKENITNCQNPYQQLIGSLMYLAVLTRADIAYSVSYLSQFNICSSEEQWIYAKRVLRYLKKTKDVGLRYCKNENVNIQGFVDSDWCNDINDRKSYTGFCYTMSGSVISWSCSKQKCIALSSTEAEYVAISEACKEAVYLRNLQYEITKTMYKITLHNDNQSAHKLLVNPIFHNRTKHIDVRFHYCRDLIAKDLVSVKYLCTNDMPADLLTKSLNTVKHNKFMNALGIVKV